MIVEILSKKTGSKGGIGAMLISVAIYTLVVIGIIFSAAKIIRKWVP